MSAELGSEREEFRRLNERVRDFIACHMPEEAMQYEEDIYVSLSTDFTREHLSHSVLHRFSGTDVLLSNTSQRSTGLRQETFCAVTLISMANRASIVLLSMMMPLGSHALVCKVSSAAGFHLGRLLILHLSMDSPAVVGNPEHYGKDAGYWTRTRCHLSFRWITCFVVLSCVQSVEKMTRGHTI